MPSFIATADPNSKGPPIIAAIPIAAGPSILLFGTSLHRREASSRAAPHDDWRRWLAVF